MLGDGALMVPGVWLWLSVLWRQRRDGQAVLASFQEDLDSSIKGGFMSKLIVLQGTRKVMFGGYDPE